MDIRWAKDGDAAAAHGDLGFIPGSQLQHGPTVAFDGGLERGHQLLDALGARARRQQEALGTLTHGVAAVELALLRLYVRSEPLTLERQHAGRHVVGLAVAFLRDAV